MPSLRRLELFHVAVPLKKRIKHASHDRASSDNLVARVELDDGSVGYGEGVPRPYVTGETIETAIEALKSFDAAQHMARPMDFPSAVDRIGKFTLPSILNDPRGMFGNAARATLEIALLDAYGHAFQQSLGTAIRIASQRPELLSRVPTRVRYSGAITAESTRKEIISAFKMRIYGFAQVKLKVGVEGQDDPTRLAKIRNILGPKIDIRIDANEAWQASDLIGKMARLKPFKPTCIEQPVPHAQVGELAEIRKTLGVDIMLDESLCGYPDGLHAIEAKIADIFNVRISKCGGMLTSLRLIELADAHGLDVQLGCHPGETGILSAAGRHLASNVKGLRYIEGSYDKHILATNLTKENLTFSYGGWAKPIAGPGLGIVVDRASLEAMTVTRHEISYA
jgi:muconate cycloisomerase